MKLKVLFYNIQFMFPFIINEASHDRAQKIANFINSMGDIDSIVFCEAFDKNARERLILYLYKNNFKYSTPILTTNNYFFNGGVFIISKYPILNYKFYIYKNSIGTDYFTNKGVVYACIKIKNKLVNIFGTHLQAWCSYNFIRNKQIIELKEFIKKFKFQSDDVVIICGDFNTSLKNIPKIFVSPVLISKQKYSFDSSTNSFVGIDNIYTNHVLCNEKIEKHKKENLDYIFNLLHTRVPEKSFTEIIPVKTESYNIDLWKIGWFKSINFTTKDLSDHYPVLNTFMYSSN